MPEEPDDWRLNGQGSYLNGVTLQWKRYEAPRPDWDHDHCAFCWAKFMAEGAWPDAPEPLLHEGWATADGSHWICHPCFSDFRVRFGWIVAPESQSRP